MGLLLAVVILWLGVARPVESGLKSAIERHGAALDRNAAIRTKVAALKKLPQAAAGAPAVPVMQLVGESAGEAGFTLDRNQEQGPGRVDIAMASVRPQAFFSWLAQLEAQNIIVDSMSAQPGAGTGTISVQAVLKGRGQ
jgi:general secretion pathway protein M